MGNRKAKGPPLGLSADFAPFSIRERFRITAIGHSSSYDAQGGIWGIWGIYLRFKWEFYNPSPVRGPVPPEGLGPIDLVKIPQIPRRGCCILSGPFSLQSFSSFSYEFLSNSYQNVFKKKSCLHLPGPEIERTSPLKLIRQKKCFR